MPAGRRSDSRACTTCGYQVFGNRLFCRKDANGLRCSANAYERGPLEIADDRGVRGRGALPPGVIEGVRRLRTSKPRAVHSTTTRGTRLREQTGGNGTEHLVE